MTSNQRETGVHDSNSERLESVNASSFGLEALPSQELADHPSGAHAPSYSRSHHVREIFPFYLELLEEVKSLGLDDLGLAPVGDAKVFEIFAKRVRDGSCAKMTYLTDAPETRRSPRSVLPDAETIIVVALSEGRLRDESRETTDTIFNAPELQGAPKSQLDKATVAGYASCVDYHDALRKRLKGLVKFLKKRFPDASTRAVVDTAPLLEKYWATEAGLGFIGLNTLTISPTLGSRFFLGEILTSTTMEALCGASNSEDYLQLRASVNGSREESFDAHSLAQRCLSCRRCVDACPTDALLGDRTLDARRCLNYWTIENRDDIPEDIGRLLGGRLFGCDLCQRVCPHNTGVETADAQELPLDAVERLDEETFRRLFRKTPIFRARLDGLKRVAQSLRRQQKRTDDGTNADSSSVSNS